MFQTAPPRKAKVCDATDIIGTAAQLSRASHFVPEQRSKKEVILRHALGIVDTGNDSHSTHGNDNLSI